MHHPLKTRTCDSVCVTTLAIVSALHGQGLVCRKACPWGEQSKGKKKKQTKKQPEKCM